MNSDDDGSAPVRWERRGAVAVVTLSRPDRRNALSNPLVLSLVGILQELEADRDVRSVVLAGEGRAFCSGGDLADVADRISDGEAWSRLEYLRSQQRLVTALRESRLPVVAVVSGAAYGAGWSIVLACDLVVASEDARFCQVFVKRDLVPDLGSAWLLPRAAGALVAKELMLLGDEITARRAYELGLVNRLADSREEATAEALALAVRLCEVSPATMAMAKSLINASEHGSLADALRLEEHAQSIALGTEQTLDSLRAFLEKQRTSSIA
jgi:2-(1,2-epoxy-1,2-dihydrophenyl)acetyl-CoA isomerase